MYGLQLFKGPDTTHKISKIPDSKPRFQNSILERMQLTISWLSIDLKMYRNIQTNRTFADILDSKFSPKFNIPLWDSK